MPPDLQNVVSTYPTICVNEKALSDSLEDPEPIYFLYLLDPEVKHPERIFLLQNNTQDLLEIDNEKYTCLIGVKILTFHHCGLIHLESQKFENFDSNLEKRLLDQIFCELKALYHEHTHHDGNAESAADMLTLLHISDSKEDAISKILQWYQNKINTYHYKIRDLIKVDKKSQNIEASIEIIRQAKGEFIYGLSFINYYGQEDMKLNRYYASLFEHAIQSIDTFYNEIEMKYCYSSTEHNLDLTKNANRLAESANYIAEDMRLLSVIMAILTIIIGVMTYASQL